MVYIEKEERVSMYNLGLVCGEMVEVLRCCVEDL